jgi:hypothetical protein
MYFKISFGKAGLFFTYISLKTETSLMDGPSCKRILDFPLKSLKRTKRVVEKKVVIFDRQKEEDLVKQRNC